MSPCARKLASLCSRSVLRLAKGERLAASAALKFSSLSIVMPPDMVSSRRCAEAKAKH